MGGIGAVFLARLVYTWASLAGSLAAVSIMQQRSRTVQNDHPEPNRLVKKNSRMIVWIGINIFLPATTLGIAAVVLFLTEQKFELRQIQSSLPILLVIALGAAANACNDLREEDRERHPGLNIFVPGLVALALFASIFLVLVYGNAINLYKSPFNDLKTVLLMGGYAAFVIVFSTGLRWHYIGRATESESASERSAADDAEPRPSPSSDRVRKWVDPVLSRIGKGLRKLNVHPDAVTVLGLIVVMLGALAIILGALIESGMISAVDPSVARETPASEATLATPIASAAEGASDDEQEALSKVAFPSGWFILGGLLFAFGLLLDAIDGAVARAMNRTGRFGMVLDSSLDRIEDGLIYAALAFFFAVNNEFALLLLTLAALLGSFAVSYVRARAEDKAVDVKAAVGLLSRLERSLILVIMILAAGLLNSSQPLLVGLLVLTIGTAFTSVRRLDYVRLELRKREAANAS